MYSSQFDANSAFNGGGFTSSQSTDHGSSPAKGRETYGLVPATVKQISEASDSGDDKSNFVINGVDVANVTLIGMVSKKAERVTDVSFTIDDGTGQIHCNRWPVTNFDELTFHFVECIHFQVQNSRTKQGDATTQSHSVTPSTNTASRDGSNGYQSTPPNHFSGQFSVEGLKGFDQMVLDYLQQPSNFGREKGVHRDELSQKLKLPMEKIIESIRTLEEEGMIYSTIDEFHFKSTTSV
ncbi:hypothetical protein RHGRI_020538 [Rhododendron griersonianum]|uniref:Replication protein A C-terminal domain-containing protein n=1 Tax=Rhododendron griersonianum TaxID=479676 RepID=A0AAV6JHZ6_9ERIC|nr:hypothetical protein RHGRI_020538 [Rhododendron griersonianum]